MCVPTIPVRGPRPYVDKLLIDGKGGVHHIWGCDHYKTTLNADKFKQAYKKRTDMVKDAMSAVPYGDRKAMVDAHPRRDQAGRAVRGRRRHRADQDRPGLPRLAAGGDGGRDEPHFDERRAPAAADRTLHGPARPGHARLPHRGAARQQPRTRVPRNGTRGRRGQVQGLRLEDRGRRLHGRLSQARQGRRIRHLRTATRHGHERRPGAGDRLRPTASSSGPSASMPTASSPPRTARRGSWTRRGAGSRRRARRRN